MYYISRYEIKILASKKMKLFALNTPLITGKRHVT